MSAYGRTVRAMNSYPLFAACLALTAFALPATPAHAQDEVPQAAIAAVNHGAALRDWEADEDQGLWVEDANAQWYYATFTSSCPALRLATTLGFETGAADRLDRSSAILVPSGARCQLSSLTPSVGPDAVSPSSDAASPQ
jgi:Family of unknown function (DUF6491)